MKGELKNALLVYSLGGTENILLDFLTNQCKLKVVDSPLI